MEIAIAVGPQGNEVNPHYFDHLLATAATLEVEVVEDIFAGNGTKLLAKGARVNASTQERLLQYKLIKPLEQCVGVIGGISPSQLADIAEGLLAQHALLRALATDSRAQPLPQSLARLRLTSPLLSLLNLYATAPGARLSHAVGVALIAMALARRLVPGDIELHREVGLAGLLHDVGELYLDPVHLLRDKPLQAEQWRQIVSHPVVAHRVLLGLDGGGPALAGLVLSHHERLDGFGYPRGLRGAQFTAPMQALAAAEWLMGLIEGGACAITHSSVASKLIPGEFSDAVRDLLRAAARSSDEPAHVVDEQRGLADALPRAVRVAEVLMRFREARGKFDDRLASASPELRKLIDLCRQRMLQLQSAFSSAGLDTDQPETLVTQLVGEGSEVQLEVLSLVREFGWRMRELERELMLRAGLMGHEDRVLVETLIDTLKSGARTEA